MARPPAPRFLAPNGRAGNGLGYYTQPQRAFPEHRDPDKLAEEAARVREATCTCDEPESESGAWLNATSDRAFMLNQQARLADIAQAHKMRPMLTMENRMADAQRRARMQNIDIRKEFTAVRRMLDAAKTESDRRRARTETAAARRLEGIELRLDQPPSDLAA